MICMIDTCDIEQKKQTCINSLIQLCVMLISTALFLHNTIYTQKILMLLSPNTDMGVIYVIWKGIVVTYIHFKFI